jgi:hypothetical protein
MKLSLHSIARLLVTLYAFSPIFGIPFWIGWLQADGELPPQIASHWGFDGRVDGFMSPSDFGVAMAIIFAVLWLLMTWILWTPRVPDLTRWVVVLPLIFVYLGLLNLVIESVLAQRGLTDVTTVQLPLTPLLVMFAVIPLILGFTLTLPRVKLANGRLEASVWAIPVYRIDREQIQAVELVQLRARDYGGLGLRFGKHGFAVIPRPGVGIKVHHRNGQTIAIRCDNANALVEQLNERND